MGVGARIREVLGRGRDGAPRGEPLTNKRLLRELMKRGRADAKLHGRLLRKLTDEELLAELSRRDAKGTRVRAEQLSERQRAQMLAASGDEALTAELRRRIEEGGFGADADPRLIGELVSSFRPTQRLEYERFAIELAVSSGFSYKRLRAYQKEPFTVRWLERSVGPGDVVYDIGANVGAYSLIAAKLGGRVYAFEPGAANLADLSRNIALNHAESSVTALPVALWSRTGLASFGYRSLEPGDAGHAVAEDGAPPTTAESAQEILAVRLDDAVSLLDLPAPALVKLDVDGPELTVLEGAVETISPDVCRSIMVEVNGPMDGPNANELAALLERCGFRLAERHDRGIGAYCLYEKRG